MICEVKDCNKDTEFDIDRWCNYHWFKKIEANEELK